MVSGNRSSRGQRNGIPSRTFGQRDIECRLLLARYLHRIFRKSTQSSNPELVAIENVKEVPMVAIPLVVTAILSLILGLYPDYFLELAREVLRGTGMP